MMRNEMNEEKKKNEEKVCAVNSKHVTSEHAMRLLVPQKIKILFHLFFHSIHPVSIESSTELAHLSRVLSGVIIRNRLHTH